MKKWLIASALLVLVFVGVGIAFFLGPVVVWGVWPWSAIKINKPAVISLIQAGGRDVSVFKPLLLDVKYEVPRNEDFIVWQRANAQIADSLAFGCNWARENPPNPPRLNLYIDVKRYLSYADKNETSSRLNKGIGLCLIWNDKAAESIEEVKRLTSKVDSQLEKDNLIYLK